MTFWAEAKRLSYTMSDDDFREIVVSLGFSLPDNTTCQGFRDIYRRNICDHDGWPTDFPLVGNAKIAEGIRVKSLSGAITGMTTGNRRRCSATSSKCPGWFIEVIWETGQRLLPCSEGWHFDADSATVSIIGGGEISARFITPKPLGTNPAPRNEWPSRKHLMTMRGWRVHA